MNFEVGDIVIYNPNLPEDQLLHPLERKHDHCKIIQVGEYYLNVVFLKKLETNDFNYDIIPTSISYLPNTTKYYKNVFKKNVLEDYMKTVLSKYVNKCYEYKTNNTAEIGPCNIILQFLYSK